MFLSDYNPHPTLITPVTEISKSRFPVIDAHNHLGQAFGAWDKRPVAELLDTLDQANVRVYVDLDGGRGEDTLRAHLDHFKAAAPDRFCVFGGVDWTAWQEQGDRFGEYAAARLRAQAALGTDGLKVWKEFGLRVRDQHGALVAVDDARLDPLWKTAAELQLPVLIHVADPVAFFAPLDANNERWEELHARPDWHFPSPLFPTFGTIVDSLANLVARHPHTSFIGAHVGCYAENLKWVGELLDQRPNFYVDISARIGELGRQPRAARRFFLKYADRILFGTDTGPDLNVYRLYYRFLETDDEYFGYDVTDIPRQGRWQIYGLALPDDVLEKVYYRNAERIILRRRD
jgi:predicted TIM-barrel fold metal-dependent hydrolase